MHLQLGWDLLQQTTEIDWKFQSISNLEAFLRKTKTGLSYRAKRSTTFASICDDADCKLFTRITGNTQHLLYQREHHFTQSLPQCRHNFQLAYLIAHPFSATRTLLWECCMIPFKNDDSILGLPLVVHYVNSVLSVILLKLESKWKLKWNYDIVDNLVTDFEEIGCLLL